MTLRARTSRPKTIRTRVRRMFEGEERQQAAVTALFVGVIAAIVLILLGVIGLSWYNDNLRPLARVGSAEIGPQQLIDRIELQQWRIQTEINRLTTAGIDKELDAETLEQRTSALRSELQALQSTGLDDLVDLVYQSQLAAADGITVTDADVDAAIAKEFNAVERRHVLAIYIMPGGADPIEEGDLTNTDRLEALQKAQDALAALASGRDFADVAREFSDDPSGLNGGDIGFVSEVGVADEEFGDRLFGLPLNGTTEIVRGQDGIYRIGRVIEIRDAPEEPGLRDQLREDVSDQALRDMLRHEVAVDKLSEKITTAALAETPEQARIAIIYIEGLPTGDPEESEGEIDYSEIAYAPNDELETAPDVPAEDPAWEVARTAAQTTYDVLIALEGEARETRFKAIASFDSDSPSKEDEGSVGFVTRSLPPTEVANALFDTPHEPGDLIGLVKTDAAYYVLLFHERRDSPDQRVAKVKEELAKPGADFAAIAREHSDGPEAEDGGEVGWLTREQLADELVEKVFALSPGQVSEPLELGEGQYFIKVYEKMARPLDPDQIPDVRASAFENWYAPKRQEAEDNGTIVFADASSEEVDPELELGGDE